MSRDNPGKTIPDFLQILTRPRNPLRQSRRRSWRVPTLTLRLVTCGRTSFSEPLVWSGISGRSRNYGDKITVTALDCNSPPQFASASVP